MHSPRIHFKSRISLFTLCVHLLSGGFLHGQIMWNMVHDELYEVEREIELEVASRHALKGVMATNKAADLAQGWRKNITATVFWVGEKACKANPVHNKSSSWDVNWVVSYGGVDTPQKRKGLLPRYFKPKMNPFYIALPYNDIAPKGVGHKPEAAKVIWWYEDEYVSRYRSVCKGKWIAIEYNGKTCYAQWEDCGPFVTNDWEYVFQGKQPKKNRNDSAGIDLSPAIRDYLKLRSGHKVAWKFVDEHEVKTGPWSKWLVDNSIITTNP